MHQCVRNSGNMTVLDSLKLELWIGLVLAVYLVWKFFRTRLTYWKIRGVPHLPPWPLLGNVLDSKMRFRHMSQTTQEQYDALKGHPYGGTYLFMSPVFLVRDPDLVHTVTVKDFSVFYDRGIKVNPELDPLSVHLVFLEGQLWKKLRNKLTPVFSSGKLKTMHSYMAECSDALVKHMDQLVSGDQGVEVREVMARFTTDVIGSCVFGINMSALKDPNSQFRAVGKTLFKPSLYFIMYRLLRVTSPSLLKTFKMSSLPAKTIQFFRSLVTETIHARESGSVVRNDFIQLLINLRKQESKKLEGPEANEDDLILDDSLLVSNSYVFFAAGFETTASSLSYCLFELAHNQDVQERLYEEVKAVMDKHQGQLTYEAAKELKYLEQVVMETLRLHPPVVSLTRVTKCSYQVPDSSLVLPKGQRVLVPVYSLHHDPLYWPKPLAFDPDRFAEPARAAIRKGTYLPFGDGPRMCIGMRFAQMEMHLALAYIVHRYRVAPHPKTPFPLEYTPMSVLLVPKKSTIWLRFHSRR